MKEAVRLKDLDSGEEGLCADLGAGEGYHIQDRARLLIALWITNIHLLNPMTSLGIMRYLQNPNDAKQWLVEQNLRSAVINWFHNELKSGHCGFLVPGSDYDLFVPFFHPNQHVTMPSQDLLMAIQHQRLGQCKRLKVDFSQLRSAKGLLARLDQLFGMGVILLRNGEFCMPPVEALRKGFAETALGVRGYEWSA